jgi:hypothetical protein
MQVVDKEHVLHCKIARILKRVVSKHVQFGGDCMPDGDSVLHAMHAVEILSDDALEWLKGRLNTSPDKLTQLGKAKDTELIDCLTVSIHIQLHSVHARVCVSCISIPHLCISKSL